MARSSLADGRHVFIDGRQVDDLATDPSFAAEVEWSERSERACDSARIAVPLDLADLRALVAAMGSLASVTSATLQSIATTATVLARSGIRDTTVGEHLGRYLRECVSSPRRIAFGVVDPETHGPRLLQSSFGRPIVRGLVTNVAAPLADELLVLGPPAGSALEGTDWFCGVVSLTAPGVSMIATSSAPRAADAGRFPYSSRFPTSQATVVLDDVTVEPARLFAAPGPGSERRAWVEYGELWHHVAALSRAAIEAQRLVGLGSLIAEANGLDGIAHIDAKLGELATYSTTLDAAIEAAGTAAEHAGDSGCRIVVPNARFVHAGIAHVAEHRHLAVRNLHDIGGGAIVTAPSLADLAADDIGTLVAKYMRTTGDIDADHRLRIFHAVRDLTADRQAGWTGVAVASCGGGPDALRSRVAARYDTSAARLAALEATGGAAC